MWLRIEFIPRLQPCAERVLVCSPYIDAFRFRDRLCQLFFYLRLRFAEDIFNQSLAGLFVISGCVSPFPAPILALADVAFTVCPFLCHVRASFVLVAQTTTTEGAQSLLIFSKDWNIFSRFRVCRKSLFFVYCGAVFACASCISLCLIRRFHPRPMSAKRSAHRREQKNHWGD